MKRIGSLILVLVVLFTANMFPFVYAKDDDNSEKIICPATLEDDFADD